MSNFIVTGAEQSQFLSWFTDGLRKKFVEKGYEHCHEPVEDISIVFNVLDPEKPRPFRRHAQATFVISIIEQNDKSTNTLQKAYPYLIRSLANHLVYIVHNENQTKVFFVTPEQGFYSLTYHNDDEDFFNNVFERLEPVASSQLVINNEFSEDLKEELWEGNERTEKLSQSGKQLDRMNLLPAPFPIENYLNKRDLRQLKKLYGIGGLSYGNLSCREDEDSFWMSASGINKADMKVIGQDMLYITGFNEEKNAMEISIPPNVTPKRASVDAIEHWMIYKEHPEVGAIVHIHAWADGVKATEINYPCGTIQLAERVAELIRSEEDPSRAIIGLKNHGLTITGRSLEDIFKRIEGRIQHQVPMSS
ncbi:class II aldolase/adducin family protein [Alkalibacillus haloalkaliphilus]|uniref:class II aldolase/adducin family protein n=1 Tax=Alkalibacillus haloalkaliphilus TaxID=94136 RepID=UPI000311A44C|nr:class II aldolase/adducin family protein [Alkalibacillus haloalkaliphilus]